jgi:hypothetical protein
MIQTVITEEERFWELNFPISECGIRSDFQNLFHPAIGIHHSAFTEVFDVLSSCNDP